jgi:hypothetical protein
MYRFVVLKNGYIYGITTTKKSPYPDLFWGYG